MKKLLITISFLFFRTNITCTTPGCQTYRHPGVGTHDTRVSSILRPGCRTTFLLSRDKQDSKPTTKNLFIEVLLKCFKLIFPSDTALPPCTPKACTVADKLNKCGSNGVYSNTQTLILNCRIYADQQCIKKNWRDTKYAKRRSQ